MNRREREKTQALLDDYCEWLQDQPEFQKQVHDAMVNLLVYGKPVGQHLH